MVTVSEYGIIRSWSWAGVAMGQATEELTEQVAVADKNRKTTLYYHYGYDCYY